LGHDVTSGSINKYVQDDQIPTPIPSAGKPLRAALALRCVAILAENRDGQVMRLKVLVTRYATFAAAAIAINLLGQWLVFALYSGPHALLWALAGGTGAGLITKYTLDKNWIFFDPEGGLRAHRRKFALYMTTGIITTAIFWGTEVLAAWLGQNPGMKYLGGFVGLLIGYVLKYRLDRAFVFGKQRETSF
jgi:putative flippase GtrA